MKKIMFVIPTIERGGGAERFCVFLANALHKKGYQVSIQLLTKKNVPVYPVENGVKVLQPPCFRLGIYGAVIHFLWRALIHKDLPECVIAFLEPANVFVSVLSRFIRPRIILTERSNPVVATRNQKSTQRIKKALPAVAKFVVQTYKCAEKFTEYLPVTKEQLTVIYNPAVDHCSNREQQKIKSDILLAVGRLCYPKGYDRMFRVFAEIHSIFPEKQLFICGDGPDKESLIALTKLYNIDNAVHFLGNVENITDYYKKADVFLMTSHYEGMPNAMLEACANGCPAISFDFDFGASDIIEHNVNGLLIPQDDEKAFAEALIQYLKDPEMRKRFVANIPETMKKFDPDVITDQWEKLIEEVTEKGH